MASTNPRAALALLGGLLAGCGVGATNPAPIGDAAPAPTAVNGRTQPLRFFLDPAAALLPGGDALAAWSTGLAVLVAERGRMGWGAPVVLATHAAVTPPPCDTCASLPPPLGSPRLLVDARGDGLALWTSPEGLMLAHRSSSGAWTAPAAVPGTRQASVFDAGLDGAGTLLVLWHEDADGAIRAARQAPGAAWQTSELDRTSADFQVTLALAPDGSALALWTAWRTFVDELTYSQFVPGRGWSTPAVIVSRGIGVLGSPKVVLDPEGIGWAAWAESYFHRSAMVGSARWDGARWSEVHVPAAAFAGCPTLGLAEGVPTLLWCEGSDLASSQAAGHSTWGPARPVSGPHRTTRASLPRLALGRAEAAAAAWVEERLDRGSELEPSTLAVPRPLLTSHRRGGLWDGPARLSVSGQAVVPALAIATDAGLEVIVVWMQSDDGLRTLRPWAASIPLD